MVEDVLDEDDGGQANQHPHDDHFPRCGRHTLLASITLVSGASEYKYSFVILIKVEICLTCTL